MTLKALGMKQWHSISKGTLNALKELLNAIKGTYNVTTMPKYL